MACVTRQPGRDGRRVSAGQGAPPCRAGREADPAQGRRRAPRSFARHAGLDRARAPSCPGRRSSRPAAAGSARSSCSLFVLLVGGRRLAGDRAAGRRPCGSPSTPGGCSGSPRPSAWSPCSGSVVIVAGYRMLAAPGTDPRAARRSAPSSSPLLVVAVALPAVFVGRVAPRPARPRRRRVRRRPRVGDRGGRPRTRSATRSGSTSCCSAATAVRAGTASAPTPSSWPASTPRPVRRRCSACRATSRTCRSRPTARWPSSTPTASTPASESESLLNAVYRNGPAEHPDVLGPTDDPGADFLKLGVGEALGLDLDYFVLVNLDGFSRLVDALGGITVNVNYYVPIGGIPDSRTLPDDYIAPGPNQLLDGAPGARLRPRPVRAHRLRPHGPPALHDRRHRRRGRPGDPAAQLPGARGHHAGHREHRHPRARPSTTSSTWRSWSRTRRSAASSSTRP